MKLVHHIISSPVGEKAVDLLMQGRAFLFAGNRVWCPCCDGNYRIFTRGGMSFRTREFGYCPRCNSKPRHRWLWHYLQENTDLLTKTQTVMHVAPSYSLSRSFRHLKHLKYTIGDRTIGPDTNIRMDITQSPLASELLDVIICLHVLEHVVDDHSAIHEIFRMLKWGGWAMVGVPARMDQVTYENPDIVTPEDREREFGERDHVRYYGKDIIDRLEQVGFNVTTFRAVDLDKALLKQLDMRDSEVMFLCEKIPIGNDRNG